MLKFIAKIFGTKSEKDIKRMMPLVEQTKKEGELRRYSKNIDKVSNILTDQLNLAEMLQNKFLLMSKDSVKMLEEKYKEKVKSEKK